jgi:plastocyanin
MPTIFIKRNPDKSLSFEPDYVRVQAGFDQIVWSNTDTQPHVVGGLQESICPENAPLTLPCETVVTAGWPGQLAAAGSPQAQSGAFAPPLKTVDSGIPDPSKPGKNYQVQQTYYLQYVCDDSVAFGIIAVIPRS